MKTLETEKGLRFLRDISLYVSLSLISKMLSDGSEIRD